VCVAISQKRKLVSIKNKISCSFGHQMHQGINLQQAFRFCLQALLIFIEVSSRAIAPNEMKKNTEGTNETQVKDSLF
jgi:thioredoxin-related protein